MRVNSTKSWLHETMRSETEYWRTALFHVLQRWLLANTVMLGKQSISSDTQEIAQTKGADTVREAFVVQARERAEVDRFRELIRGSTPHSRYALQALTLLSLRDRPADSIEENEGSERLASTTSTSRSVVRRD